MIHPVFFLKSKSGQQLDSVPLYAAVRMSSHILIRYISHLTIVFVVNLLLFKTIVSDVSWFF